MNSVPRTAVLLGLAGLIPFIWGVLTVFFPGLSDWTLTTFGPRFVAPYVLLYYGTIILAFMSGVLWGFAARADGSEASLAYVLSVIPALWAFFLTGIGPVGTAWSLIAGFLGLLGLDWFFWKNRLTPPWWMALRVPLTIVVVLSLSSVALA